MEQMGLNGANQNRTELNRETKMEQNRTEGKGAGQNRPEIEQKWKYGKTDQYRNNTAKQNEIPMKSTATEHLVLMLWFG